MKIHHASSASGASAGRADFRELVFKKLLDKSSPQLAQACADGTHFDELLLTLHRAGSERVKFMEYRLQNCLIQQVITSGGRYFPIETVRINYGKIMWVFTRQSLEGGYSTEEISQGGGILKRNCKM